MTLLLAVLLAAQAPASDRPARCEALYQEGRRLYFDGRFEAARGSFRAAQVCAREDWGHDDTLSQRYEGLCFQYEDRLDEALALFRAAADALAAQERSRHGGELPETDTSVADALNNVGWALHLTGDDAAARVELERALVLAPDAHVDRAVGVWIHGRIRTNLAVVTGALGDASTADAQLRRVVATESGDRMNRTRALEHLGRLEESWGDFEAALARYEEALATGEAALRDAAPTPYNRAYLVGALSRLGFLRERLGRPDSAREALDRALATARELGTRHLIAQVLLDRGRLARESGDLGSALASHEEALALATSARLEPDEALALFELGQDALGRGDAEAALALFERALESKAVSAPEIAGAVHSGIARARERLGRLGTAAEQDELAVAAVESVRLGTLAEPRRLGFWRLRQGIFRSAIALRHRLLVASGDARHAERALELAEQARSRTLLDLISRGVVPVGPESEGGAWTVARLRAELLAGDIGLVSFALDEPRSWAWVLTRDACLMAVLPGRGEIEHAVRAWRKRIASGARYGAEGHAEAARLHALLLSPLAPRLDPLRRLVIVGDGVLHLVPFEALEDEGGRVLLERHVVSYAPSASVAGALHERRSARSTTAVRLLAYAEPPSEALGPLPLARREAQAIAALFPVGAAEVRQGARASESWLKHADLGVYGTLHFATHGTYDDRAPGRSALVLAPGQGEDGLLQVREIASLPLRARLVSLSACDTGLGEVVTGEGVVGLARAFLRAGADAVATTLWRVPDASTAELMQRFYTHMRAGRPAAEALREAKLELRRGRASRRAPFHWAGVVLSGEAEGGLPAF